MLSLELDGTVVIAPLVTGLLSAPLTIGAVVTAPLVTGICVLSTGALTAGAACGNIGPLATELSIGGTTLLSIAGGLFTTGVVVLTGAVVTGAATGATLAGALGAAAFGAETTGGGTGGFAAGAGAPLAGDGGKAIPEFAKSVGLACTGAAGVGSLVAGVVTGEVVTFGTLVASVVAGTALLVAVVAAVPKSLDAAFVWSGDEVVDDELCPHPANPNDIKIANTKIKRLRIFKNLRLKKYIK